MNATERMKSRLGYIQYNYGKNNPIRLAAEKGDIEGFRKAAAHITEDMDVGVVEILDARD